MITRTVYLAGPITGTSYKTSRLGWRTSFAALLPHDIEPLSPMRGKDFLLNEANISGAPDMYLGVNPLAEPKGILCRDENDVRRCDAMVACFLDATKVSIGTCHEFGMARILRKPIILIMEKDGSNPHHHAFITESAGYWVDNIFDGANLLRQLLGTGI